LLVEMFVGIVVEMDSKNTTVNTHNTVRLFIPQAGPSNKLNSLTDLRGDTT